MPERSSSMHHRRLLMVTLCICSLSVHAQSNRHIIGLTDKKATTFNFNNPSAYLSQRSIDRRTRYGIALDSSDLPVCKSYIDSIASVSNITVLGTSKWLNQVLVYTTDASALQKVRAFPFVRGTQPVTAKAAGPALPVTIFRETVTETAPAQQGTQRADLTATDYGNGYGQVHIHEGEYLHDRGFMGQGMIVAMLDAGFQSYLTNRAFDSLRKAGRVLGTWDFVKNEASVNEDDSHGANCLSIMASNLPGILVGTAPRASYYLFRTEDAATEFPVEEHYWAAGAERADSLGADLITSSLGYTTFDDPTLNHSYADMNGKTTMVTRAADMAVKKGMIVTNSAGNSGSSSWKYIGAPADGDSVVAVGAVDVNGQPASFSSYGPSSDGRVKPDLASVGFRTFVINTNGSPAQGNGTSYSNPNLAGLILCLWQAFPEFSNMKILEALKKTASRYSAPDERIGYGIPNMRAASEWLQQERRIIQAAKILGNNHIKVYPIPFSDRLNIVYRAKDAGKIELELIDAAGRILRKGYREAGPNELLFIEWPGLGRLPAGVYFIRYRDASRKGTLRLVK